MELTGSAIIYLIMAISASLYLAAKMYLKLERHRQAARRQYREHIDHLAAELFPASIQTPEVQTAIDQLQTSNEDLEYREAKRKMVADVRRYFNQRKMRIKMLHSDSAISDSPDPDTLYLK